MEQIAKDIIVLSLVLLVLIVAFIEIAEWRRRLKASRTATKGPAPRESEGRAVDGVPPADRSGIAPFDSPRVDDDWTSHLEQPLETLERLFEAAASEADRIRLGSDIGFVLDAALRLDYLALLDTLPAARTEQLIRDQARWLNERDQHAAESVPADQRPAESLAYHLAFIRETKDRIRVLTALARDEG
jgi:uncharacterized protein YecT (DUF1311 family)